MNLMKSAKLTLSEYFMYLLSKKSFYARLALGLQRVMKPGLGTMAVAIHKGRIVMYVDPAFMENLPLEAGGFVLEHEMLHLVLDHIPRYLELLANQLTEADKQRAHKVANIAMDAAINTMLRRNEGFNAIQEHLKKEAKNKYDDMVHERNQEAQKNNEPAPVIDPFDDSKVSMVLPELYDLPQDGFFEMYQHILMQRIKDQGGDGGMDFHGGNHDHWATGDGERLSPDQLRGLASSLREQAKQVLRSAVKSMGKNARGLLPGDLGEILQEYLAEPVIPWWEVFSTRAKTSRNAKRTRTCSRPNRALLALSEEDDRIIPNPGRAQDKTWRVFLMVDTSGSMSTESLEIARNELMHMLNADNEMEIRYMQGDCQVHSDVLLKTGDEIPDDMPGRGGTDFNAYFEHMAKYVGDSEKAPDLVVVYTDGFAPPVSPDNRLPDDIPVIWLVTPEYDKSFTQGYGEILVCDPGHNERRQ